MTVNTMIRRGIAPILVALCVLIGGSSLVGAAATTYSDPLNRFSFTVPDGWQSPMTNDNAFYQFTDMADNATFSITVEPKPEEGSLADLTQVLVGISSLTPQYQADSSGVQDAMIGGVAAKTFAYTAPGDGGTTAATRVYLLIHNNEALYQITVVAPPDKMQASVNTATQSLLNSWKFA